VENRALTRAGKTRETDFHDAQSAKSGDGKPLGYKMFLTAQWQPYASWAES
jgi:hypothetical protein